MKCAYCGEKITERMTHGILGSGLVLHESIKKPCGTKAFQENSWRAKKFRFKNAFLFKWYEWNFWVGWFIYNFKKMR